MNIAKRDYEALLAKIEALKVRDALRWTVEVKPDVPPPLHLYSSRLLALRACRFEMEEIFAKRLREIDKLIEKELEP